jgi:MYXO-CTERM domain-containing protein
LVYKEPNSGNAIAGLDAWDATHAWAIGMTAQGGNSSPFGIRTSDGVTWDPMGLPTGYLIAMYLTISFADAQTGWMGGFTGKGGRVWKTTDGGGAWAEVAQLGQDAVAQVQALPTGEMFAVGSGVVLVYDGQQYTNVAVTVPSGLSLKAVRMLNSTCGYVMAGAASGSAPGAALFSTGDGGKTWEQKGSALGYTLSKMSWVNKDLGWAVGSQAGAAVVARTTDGGKTWTPTNVPDHPAMGAKGVPAPATECMDVKFFDNLRGVATCVACTGCDTDAGGDPTYLTVFVRTEDGGQSWTMDPDYEAVMVAPPFGAFAKFSGMYSLAFPDPNNGYLAGTNNLVLRYVADNQEAPGWPAADCTSSGGQGSGGSGAGKTAPTADSSDSGCGCRTKPDGTAQAWLTAALGLLVLARSKRRRK